MSRRKPIVFKGYDWSELRQLENTADKWPKLPKNFQYDEKEYWNPEDAENAYLIKEYLGGFFCDDARSKERKRVAKYVRKFCAALGRAKGDYSAPVFAGMAKIEHDEVLFSWVIRNLECMWN